MLSIKGSFIGPYCKHHKVNTHRLTLLCSKHAIFS